MNRLPFLRHADFVYTRLKAITWVSNESVLPSVVQANAGNTLSAVVQSVEPHKPLMINCRGINIIEDHALDSLKDSLIKRGKPILFTHSEHLLEDIKRALGGYDGIYRFKDSSLKENLVTVYQGDLIDRSAIEELVKQVVPLEKKTVTKFMADCYQEFPGEKQRMASTPLLASGIFDARRVISDPDRFVWSCLLMADQLEDYLDSVHIPQQAKPRKYRLLAVSLRGSPLAAAVGLLTDRQQSIEIVDHMGPKYRILEEHYLRSASFDGDYIFVGDFIVGGTELRIAETYARTKGSTLKYAVVLGVLLEPSEYQLKMGISYLVKLKECCPGAEFSFTS